MAPQIIQRAGVCKMIAALVIGSRRQVEDRHHTCILATIPKPRTQGPAQPQADVASTDHHFYILSQINAELWGLSGISAVFGSLGRDDMEEGEV